MSVTDDLVQNARAYAAAFDKGQLPMPPARQVAIVACMDARLNPYGLLGLSEGDAHVIRCSPRVSALKATQATSLTVPGQ